MKFLKLSYMYFWFLSEDFQKFDIQDWKIPSKIGKFNRNSDILFRFPSLDMNYFFFGLLRPAISSTSLYIYNFFLFYWNCHEKTFNLWNHIWINLETTKQYMHALTIIYNTKIVWNHIVDTFNRHEGTRPHCLRVEALLKDNPKHCKSNRIHPFSKPSKRQKSPTKRPRQHQVLQRHDQHRLHCPPLRLRLRPAGGSSGSRRHRSGTATREGIFRHTIAGKRCI